MIDHVIRVDVETHESMLLQHHVDLLFPELN